MNVSNIRALMLKNFDNYNVIKEFLLEKNINPIHWQIELFLYMIKHYPEFKNLQEIYKHVHETHSNLKVGLIIHPGLDFDNNNNNNNNNNVLDVFTPVFYNPEGDIASQFKMCLSNKWQNMCFFRESFDLDKPPENSLKKLTIVYPEHSVTDSDQQLIEPISTCLYETKYNLPMYSKPIYGPVFVYNIDENLTPLRWYSYFSPHTDIINTGTRYIDIKILPAVNLTNCNKELDINILDYKNVELLWKEKEDEEEKDLELSNNEIDKSIDEIKLKITL